MFKKLSDRIVGTITQDALMLFIGDTHPKKQRLLDFASKTIGQLSSIPINKLNQISFVYDLYILDASHMPSTLAIIQKIKEHQADARIILIGDNPSWQHARTAFRVGVLDYIVWEDNCEQLQLALRENLQKSIGACC